MRCSGVERSSRRSKSRLSPQRFDSRNNGLWVRSLVAPLLPEVAGLTQWFDSGKIQLDPRRKKNCVTKENGLASVEQWQAVENTGKRIGHETVDDILVFIVG